MELALGQHRPEPKLVELPQTQDLVGFLGPGVEVEGQIKVSEGSLHLNSQFKGNVQSQGTIIVGDQAHLESAVEARVVRISGKVKGSIRATEALEIKEHGVVLGDITTPMLLVEPGGYFDGQCHRPPSESPQEPPVGSLNKEPPGSLLLLGMGLLGLGWTIRKKAVVSG